MSGLQCTFALNGKATSIFNCPGFGAVAAFSGQKSGRDNPAATAIASIGPLPRGRYYLVDRQSGGVLGFLYDLWSKYGVGTTDHTKWFMLWNPASGDSTFVNGVWRGSFRLHPMGRMKLSEGCITVVDPATFNRLADFLRAQKPGIPVPGSPLKAYATVVVQ
ncbi:DUF2778 domain-containing protein [Robbsia sp. KACC 23696]|uniref:DUF2778 domain-containing protein n=1 Tax=Robbsia sp. KACC 23696 TaxID=3149231 RepID=UPI00325AA24B